jgi:TolB-like protein
MFMAAGCLFGLHAQLPVSPNIAVLDLAVKGVDSVEASVLSEKLRGEFINANRFQVIERGAVEEVLREQGLQQSGCTSNECVAQAGQLLGVKFMVAGSIGKIEQTYLLSVRMINATNGKIEASAQKEISGSLVEMLKTGVPEVVRAVCERLDESRKPITLPAPKPEPKPLAPTDARQPSGTPRHLKKTISLSFLSSAGPMKLSTFDTAGIPLEDNWVFRTAGADVSAGIVLGTSSINVRATLTRTGRDYLPKSGHEFNRLITGVGLVWYYEGLRLFRSRLVLAPGVSAGFWKISDHGTYHQEPGKQITVDFVRFLAPQAKIQTGFSRVNLLLEYSLPMGVKSTERPMNWKYMDGSGYWADTEGGYTVGALHMLSAGVQLFF